MTKIGLIVEPFFLNRHVGVRNYLFSLAGILQQLGQVDLLSYFKLRQEGRLQWYQAWPRDQSVMTNNGHASDTCFAGSPSEVLAQYLKFRQQAKRQAKIAEHDTGLYCTQIGDNLAREKYDVLIITTPWLVQFEDRLPADCLLGMVYDIIPNFYALTAVDKPLGFAGEHQRGLAYYRKYCDGVLPISAAAGEDVARYFQIDRDRIHSLPPLIRLSHFPVSPTNEERGANVVLASPFDLRKGLVEMPTILNQAADSIDQVLAYGGVRCQKKDVIAFFEQLKVSYFEWYPAASAEQVWTLFRKARALLFPSFEEGLGLPILEAQVCGCRAIVRNKAPMNQLLLPSNYLLTGDSKADGNALRAMVSAPFDHSTLERAAREKFCSSHVLRVLERVIGRSREPLHRNVA